MFYVCLFESVYLFVRVGRVLKYLVKRGVGDLNRFIGSDVYIVGYYVCVCVKSFIDCFGE